MHPQTSLVVDNWLDEEIASLQDSVTEPTETNAAPSIDRSSLRRSLQPKRRRALDKGRYVVYAFAVTVGAATGWLIALLLSKP